MRNFKKKLHGQEGFTLVEMLIVVAIIAILIAVSIPIIRSALDKARHSTDAANERAAKAAILVRELSNSITTDQIYYYNATTGMLQDNTANIKGYGQHKANGHDHTNASTGGKFLAVQIKTGDVVNMEWVTTTIGSGDPNNTGLCSSQTKVDHTT